MDSAIFLPDDLMVKNDRMTMAHSLEARVPLTDIELTGYLARVPGDVKLPGMRKKHILREALRDLLPLEILRRRKAGVELPYSRCLTRDLRDLLEEYLGRERVAALARGASLCPETRAVRIQLREGGRGEAELEIGTGEGSRRETVTWERLWSTLPLGALARAIEPRPAHGVLEAARGGRHRAMILVYLLLGTDRFTEYDAHSFPSREIPFTRNSEPRNYGVRVEPRGRTALCAEIPFSQEDPVWSLPDDALRERALEGLARAGLAVPSPLLEVAVRRLPTAYPL